MPSTFETLIDRRGSGALKTDALRERFPMYRNEDGRDDLLPMWVADMDFATPDFILDAIRQRLEHPILGYTIEPEDYRPAIIDWVQSHHGWEIQPEWISYIPGVVKGIGTALNLFTKPGDSVAIMEPVYHIFRQVIEGNGRKVVGGKEGSPAVFLLSNPHNPIGICWSREWLQALAHYCYEHHILVISDEIHADLALFGHKHIPFASVSEEAAMNSITFMAPTKTFNMAGIISAYSIIPNPDIRERYYSWLDTNELSEPNIFAPIATIAAYRNGEPWRQELIAYIEQNILFAEQYLAQHLPQVKVVRPEASFLVWLDCRALGLSHDALIDLFVNRARLALNDGEMFGHGGEGFMRMNVGCPRAVLQQALERLRDACQ
ncbi:MAG: aminotransferase class I/II-fold pyridoxal phosphate-dependent enzyme [Paludibacteraceae bacterium]|nr:aminotransferase class I/II-fold pyridoxal phosphate-dependent enzyme [Paludibacteraceae bacterium]